MPNIKKAGRPRSGVNAKNASAYYWQIFRWWKSDNLAKVAESDPAKVKDNQWQEAVEAFKAIKELWNAATMHDKQVQILDSWCKHWLTDYGWKRLQSNVRQLNRARKLKTVQLSYGAWEQLSDFANSQKLTLSEAIEKLIKTTSDLVEAPQKETFELEHDRYVWQCPKCDFTLESPDEESLRNEQSGHKYLDCPGDWN